MTDKQPTGDEQPQQVFVPVNAHQAAEPEKDPEKEAKEGGKKDKGEGAPVGQIAAGGVGAVTLGSYALASVVGPWGWAAAPAAAVAGGGAYVAYRRRKKRGARSERKTERTTTSKGSTPSGRLGGFGGGRAGSPASGGPSGTKGSSSRTASGGTSGGGGSKGGSSARPGGGSRPGSDGGKGGSKPPSSGGGRPGSASPRGGSAARGSSPKGGAAPGGSSGRGGGTSPGGKPGGGLFGRSGGRARTGSTGGSDGLTSTTKKKPGNPTPNGRGGKPGTGTGGTGGGNMPDKKPGPFRRTGQRARDWADEKTGGKVSTGWRGARGQQGFNNRRRAAGQAVKDAGGGGFIAGVIGIFAALFAGIAALFAGAKPWADRHMDSVDPDAKKPDGAPDEQPAAHGSGGGDGPQPNETPPQPQGGPKTEQPDQNKPNEAPSGAPTSGGNTMTGLPAAQIATDMTGAMSRYSPADAYQIVPDSRQWADVPTQVALSVKAYADRLEAERFPINGAINEKLREFAQAIVATRSIAEELEPLMRRAHADDLARRENPRGDESKWDVH